MRSASHLPELKLHSRGVWFTYWGRKSYYFTKDRDASVVLYHRHIANVYLPAVQDANLAAIQRRANAGKPLLIIDIAERWLAHQTQMGLDHQTVTSNRRRIRALLHAMGTMPAQQFHVTILRGVEADLRTVYDDTTVRHCIGAIKSLFKFAAGMGWIDPVNLAAVRLEKQSRPIPTIYSRSQVRQLIERAADQCLTLSTLRCPRGQTRRAIADDMRHWLSLTYLCCLRPTETVRLVHRLGTWVIHPRGDAGGAGVFLLTDSKTARHSGQGRYVVLSSEAVEHFNASTPRWRCENSWSKRVGSLLGTAHSDHPLLGSTGLPHPLRHSAATHLGEAGALDQDIARLLGHGTPGALAHYLRVARERLLPAAGLLSLRCADVPKAAPSVVDPVVAAAAGAADDDDELAGPS